MRILIVEDEKRIADSIKKGLTQEAYAVDVAYDGNAGFDLAASENYDVILLDLMLPGMDGMELIHKLRNEEKNNTPVLMLTAKGEIGDKVDGLNSGADDYLPKPFAFEELLARIKALGRRPKKGLDTILRVGDLEINTINYEVVRDNKEIELSKKEYALLVYLVKNKGNVQSKDQIIAGVWDYDADILPNTVEVYIGYLRNKVDKPFPKSKALIKTVRGFGYKIVDK